MIKRWLQNLNTHFVGNLGAGMVIVGEIVGGAPLHGSTGSLNVVAIGASALKYFGLALAYLGRPKTVTSDAPAK